MAKNKRLEIIKDIAVEMKAEDITVLDLRKFDTCGEYYIIMTANSAPHMKALIMEITKKLKTLQISVHHVEGLQSGQWVLIDCRNIIVHIFTKETRIFYNIERLWTAE